MNLAIQILVIVVLVVAIIILTATFFLILDLREDARAFRDLIRELNNRLPQILSSLEKGSRSFEEISTNLEKNVGSLSKIAKTLSKVVPLTAILKPLRKSWGRGLIYPIAFALGFTLIERLFNKKEGEDHGRKESG